jgi:hypothetical protein
MRSAPTAASGFIALALAGWCFVAAPAAAQEAPLGKIELTAAPVSLVLDDARVTITATDGAAPLLRWWRDRPDAPGAAELAAYSDGGAVVVQRPAATEGEPPARLRVELVVDTAQPLAVAGAGLDLKIERAGVEAAERLDVAPPATPPVAAATTELSLVDSQAEIGGLGGIVGVFDGSAVELRGTAGSHDLTVRGGSLRINGHQGGATLSGDGADLTVEDAGGQLTIRAGGGMTSLRSVRGRFRIELVDAGLEILDGGGSGLISVTDSSADLRGARFDNVNLKSVASHVTASACDGLATIDLTGGSLAVDGGSGALTGAARDGAVVDLVDHRGDIQLNLEEGSSAELRAVDGKVKLRARGGEVVVDRASSLEIELDGVFATLGGITALGPFKVVSSRVELDLSELARPAVELAVQADSAVRVRLATPCRVRATGLDASLASQVDVTGCELQLGAGGRWATRRVRDLEGRPPTTLTAQIAESSELTVEGRP